MKQMRKLLLFIGLIFCGFGIYAQLSLEKISFNYSANVTKINPDTYKYFIMDVPAEQCRIYNPDASLYKTINLAVPGGEWLYDVKFVSEDLFNSDTKIEVLYTYYKWVEDPGYYIYHTKVVNEDGVLLLDEPGALYAYVKEVSANEYSLFLYAYDLSVSPEKVWTNIYKLPGVPNIIDETEKTAFSIDGFPNPAGQFVNVNYQLPFGVSKAKLHFIDNRGNELEVFQVDGFSNHLRLATQDYLPGIYFYFLESEGKRSETQKLVIQ
jgi:hypothetical protein